MGWSVRRHLLKRDKEDTGRGGFLRVFGPAFFLVIEGSTTFLPRPASQSLGRTVRARWWY